MYSGLLTADALVYHIGKKYGRMVVTHHRIHRFLSSGKLAELEERFKRRGVLVILMGRHVIGLRIQILLVAGIMRMRFVKFILADAVSALFTISFMAGIGYAGESSLEIILKDVKRIEHGAIFILLSCLVCYIIFKYFQSRRKTRS